MSRSFALLLAACHAGEALELPPAETGEQAVLVAIEDPEGAVEVWAVDLQKGMLPFSARSGSILTMLFHRRSLAELFLEEGRVPQVQDGLRSLPFERAQSRSLPHGDWLPIDALTERLAAVRIAGPTHEECAAQSGFYLSEDAAARFDCYVSDACGSTAPCPAAPQPPLPPAPPRTFALAPCPQGEWPAVVPPGAAYVRPGANGDGSIDSPYGTIAAALGAHQTIALAKGDHGDVVLDAPADLIGACVETRLGRIEVRSRASITDLRSGAIIAADTSSLTLAQVQSGAVELERSTTTLRRVRIESAGMGLIVREGAVVAERLAVTAPIRGIELSSAAASLFDVTVGESETALLITGFRGDPGVTGCAGLASASLSATVQRAELGGLVHLSSLSHARLNDISIVANRDDRAFDVDGGCTADVHRIRIEGPSRTGFDINGTILLEDAEVGGAVLGLLNAARSTNCMHRIRIRDSRSLGACIDLESTTEMTDVEIARPTGAAPAITTGNLCIDGTVEGGAGMRVHQLATIDVSRFRIADSRGDAALVVYQLSGTRLLFRDGTIENNALIGAQIPEAPLGGTPFPLEQLMIRVRYANNGQTFGY
jgi:hypothetical protein